MSTDLSVDIPPEVRMKQLAKAFQIMERIAARRENPEAILDLVRAFALRVMKDHGLPVIGTVQ